MLQVIWLLVAYLAVSRSSWQMVVVKTLARSRSDCKQVRI